MWRIWYPRFIVWDMNTQFWRLKFIRYLWIFVYPFYHCSISNSKLYAFFVNSDFTCEVIAWREVSSWSVFDFNLQKQYPNFSRSSMNSILLLDEFDDNDSSLCVLLIVWMSLISFIEYWLRRWWDCRWRDFRFMRNERGTREWRGRLLAKEDSHSSHHLSKSFNIINIDENGNATYEIKAHILRMQSNNMAWCGVANQLEYHSDQGYKVWI